jgi:hypothetical protein
VLFNPGPLITIVALTATALKFWLPILIRPLRTFWRTFVLPKITAFLRTAFFLETRLDHKLQKRHNCWYSFIIFRLSTKFVKFYTSLPFFMALPPERYDHFKNWFQRHECFSKATSTFISGKIYMKCILCLYETPISPQGNSWHIGNFKRHWKASPKCNSNNASMSLIATANLSVRLTLVFFTFVTTSTS